MKKLFLFFASVFAVCFLCTACQGGTVPTNPPSTPVGTSDTTTVIDDVTVDPTVDVTVDPTTASTSAPLTWDELLQIAEQELASQTEIDTFSVRYSIMDVHDPVGYAMTANPWITHYVDSTENIALLKNYYPAEIYNTNAKNDLCPLSFEELCDSYDESFFNTHAVVVVAIISLDEKLPSISKVSHGTGGEYVPDWVIHCEYEEATSESKCLYQVFVEISVTENECSLNNVGICPNGKYWP